MSSLPPANQPRTLHRGSASRPPLICAPYRKHRHVTSLPKPQSNPQAQPASVGSDNQPEPPPSHPPNGPPSAQPPLDPASTLPAPRPPIRPAAQPSPTPTPTTPPSFPVTQHPRPTPYRLRPASRSLLIRRQAQAAAAATAAADVQQSAPGASPHQLHPTHNPPQPPPPAPYFRFWHDEKRFKGTGADSLVQAAMLAAGGVRVGGHIKSDPKPGPLGWQRLAAWDVLWSPSATALRAAEQGMRPGQLVSAVPGSPALTRKRNLPETLHQAYGPGAADLTPLTFQLPGQVAGWRQWMAAHPCPPGQPQRLWMLKTAEHLGRGLQLVPQSAALAALLQRTAAVMGAHAAAAAANQEGGPGQQEGGAGQGSRHHQEGQSVHPPTQETEAPKGLSPPEARQGRLRSDPSRPRPFVVAQLYVPDPLLISGRKFGLRQWMVLCGPNPLRAYLHRNGLVLFATAPYNDMLSGDALGGGGVAGGVQEGGRVDGQEGAVGSLAAAVVRGGGNDLSDDDEEEEEDVEEAEVEGVCTEAILREGPGGGGNGSGGGGPAPASARCGVQSPTHPPLGHVTNYAQNVDGDVWSLDQLKEHLGEEKYSLLYRRILRSAALSAAAALPAVRAEATRLGLGSGGAAGSSGGCFELFGLDYLVDINLRPWLLEVNATPSLAVSHSDPRVSDLIRTQKGGMVGDMLGLLNLRGRFEAGAAGGEPGGPQGAVAGVDGGGGVRERREQLGEVLQAAYPQAFYDRHLLSSLVAVEEELAGRGGFIPLMPLFPQQSPPPPSPSTTTTSSPSPQPPAPTTTQAQPVTAAAAASATRASEPSGTADRAGGNTAEESEAVVSGLAAAAACHPAPAAGTRGGMRAALGGGGGGGGGGGDSCTSGDSCVGGGSKGYLLDSGRPSTGPGGPLPWSEADLLDSYSC